jgi:thiopeptide-type bacteriocin biosynthesis protein
MKDNYSYLPELFLRAPFYSYQSYNLEQLPNVLLREDFKNAIYLASPDFYRVLEKKGFNFNLLESKEKFSLHKYYNRMCFRSTPFGSFASFTNCEWKEKESIELVDEQASILHLLPDQQLRVKLATFLKQNSNDHNLSLNPMCYLVGHEFRFVRTIEDQKGHNNFTLDIIAAEPLNVKLIKLLKKGPIGVKKLESWIRSQADCTEDEAKDYLEFLIGQQVVFTEFDGHIIDPWHIRSEIGEKYCKPQVPPINTFWKNWKNKPLNEVGSVAEASKTLENLLVEISVEHKKQHFYSAIERPISSGGLNSEYQEQLINAVGLLNRIGHPFSPPNLEKFITDFKERFDQEKIPLLMALDPDTGIGYGNFIDDLNGGELFEHIRFPMGNQEPKPIKWAKIHQLMIRLWVMNKEDDPYQPIVIKQTDLAELDDQSDGLLPSTLAIMFRTTSGKLLIESMGGATAASLIGRFSSFSEDVAELCRKQANTESAVHPELIFADIGQLSDIHVDNINRRVQIYDYEIPINVYSTLPVSCQIKPDDLLVCVKGNELILESASLKKRIIPRHTTAYNPTKTDLSIFRLFCDLQHQGLKAGMSFDMERLFPGLTFYPAVEYDQVILCPAKWVFQESDLQILKNCPKSEIIQSVMNFRQQYRLPQSVMLGTSDQQLVFNLACEEEMIFFIDCLKGESKITLKEFLQPDTSVTTDNKALAGQFIAFLKHNDKVYPDFKNKRPSIGMQTTRSFMLGSSWLYLKIYCTPQTADSLILNIISPLLDRHHKLIKRWFFIRYFENGYHLRLRIEASGDNLGLLLTTLHKQLLTSKKDHLVKEYQAGVYRRELERYGPDLIDKIEDIFFAGTQLVVAFLNAHTNGSLTTSRFQFGILMIRLMVKESLPDLSTQVAFLGKMTEGFLKEFLADKQLKMDLDKKYRVLGSEITEALENTSGIADPEHILQPDMMAFLNKWRMLSDRMDDQDRYLELLADVIHMQINRLFGSEQRKHELIIYYFLHKYASSRVARQKKGGANTPQLANADFNV